MTRGLSQFPPRLLRLIARLLERQLVLWLLLLRLLPVLSLVLLRGGVQGKATEMAEGPPALAARRGVLLHGKQQREEIRCTDAEADSGNGSEGLEKQQDATHLHVAEGCTYLHSAVGCRRCRELRETIARRNYGHEREPCP